MNYLYYDLGTVHAGATVIAHLKGTAANVQLLDTANLQRYRGGQQFSFYGGHFTRSPARIGVPSTGHWHVVIDLGGYDGQVNASVQVLAA
jgi:hypothetical protein